MALGPGQMPWSQGGESGAAQVPCRPAAVPGLMAPGLLWAWREGAQIAGHRAAVPASEATEG